MTYESGRLDMVPQLVVDGIAVFKPTVVVTAPAAINGAGGGTKLSEQATACPNGKKTMVVSCVVETDDDTAGGNMVLVYFGPDAAGNEVARYPIPAFVANPNSITLPFTPFATGDGTKKWTIFVLNAGKALKKYRTTMVTANMP